MGLHIDSMPDDQTLQAAMYGPLVLAGRFDAVTKEMTYGDYEPKPGDQKKVPDIVADASKPTALDCTRPEATPHVQYGGTAATADDGAAQQSDPRTLRGLLEGRQQDDIESDSRSKPHRWVYCLRSLK